jgi:hypothetical protein
MECTSSNRESPPLHALPRNDASHPNPGMCSAPQSETDIDRVRAPALSPAQQVVDLLIVLHQQLGFSQPVVRLSHSSLWASSTGRPIEPCTCERAYQEQVNAWGVFCGITTVHRAGKQHLNHRQRPQLHAQLEINLHPAHCVTDNHHYDQ